MKDVRLEHANGAEEPVIELGNEFAEVQIRKIHTRNGVRLLISSPKSGHSIALCPLELEALTWQNQDSLSLLINNPYGPIEQVQLNE
ncbi:MAG: dihydrodiol dehydrogenase [Actinomycetota bacterium]|nr:MAG: dihydrodiol dehydrogenase [Actinomycetota bacterium]